MKNKPILGSLFLVLLVGCGHAFGQDDGVQTRSLPSDDFRKHRPPSKSGSPAKGFNYNRIGSGVNPFRRKKADPPKSVAGKNGKGTSGRKPPVKAVPAENFTDIGVTVWKLRPPAGIEEGTFLRVQLEKGKPDALWLAERVSVNDMFQAGDRVRFAIEPSKAGFLYVFNREIKAGDTYGEPILLFPRTLAQSSYVGPGLVADIPDNTERYGYFNVEPQSATHQGELLTIILSPVPLTQFKVSKDKLLNPDELKALELEGESEVFTRNDGADKLFSKVESDASCGTKTRDLKRVDDSQRPCADVPRLTADEPMPESLYRVKHKAGTSAVIFVKMLTK